MSESQIKEIKEAIVDCDKIIVMAEDQKKLLLDMLLEEEKK